MKRYEDVHQYFMRRVEKIEADIVGEIRIKFAELRRDTRTCRYCGQLFIAERGTRTYCSNSCRLKRFQQESERPKD